jgi:hypothetical protein
MTRHRWRLCRASTPGLGTLGSMRRSPLLPIVALVSLLGVACSGGDEGSSSTTDDASASTTAAASTAPPTTTAPTTTAPPSTTATPTTVPSDTVIDTTVPADTVVDTTVPADPLAAVASTALITFEDFASGWSEDLPDDEPDDDEATDIVAECAGIDPALIGNDLLGATRVEVGFTTLDETFSLDHSVGFAADEVTAGEAFAAITDPDVPACYGEAVQQFFEMQMSSDDPADTLPPGLEIGEATATVGDLSAFALQSEVHWFHVEYPLTLDTQTFDQHADFVFFRNGAALAQVMMTGFGQPFPEGDIQGIVELVDTKLAAIA